MRLDLRYTLLMLFAVLPYEGARAQQNRTTKTLTVGVSAVNFDDLGTVPSMVAQFSVDRAFSVVLGGEISAFTSIMLGGASAIPECPPNVPCPTRATPNLMFGAHGSLLARAGDSGLRAALGVGPVWSSGSEGFTESNAWSMLIGLDWIAKSSSQRSLTLSARLVLLEARIAGAQNVFLPGIGITF